MSEAPLLSVKDLSKAFGGVQAVNRVSFDLNKGDLLGIIGNSLSRRLPRVLPLGRPYLLHKMPPYNVNASLFCLSR